MIVTPKKHEHVKEVFEQSRKYLDRRRVDIRVRAETVQAFVGGRTFGRVLDIGCGDGSISLPLLGPQCKVTLLDLSRNMLSIAQSRIPAELAHNVEIRNEDFANADVEPDSFDLVICLGVVAHVESPQEFLSKIRSVLKPGGLLILEFTDSFHLMGRMRRLIGTLKAIVAPPKYPVNRLCAADIDQLLGEQGFRVRSRYRYSLPPVPEIDRLLSQEILYKYVRLIYGPSGKNRTTYLGNEYICLVSSDTVK